MKATKILFLDFDDVLNTKETLDRGELFENANIEAFNSIVDRVDVGVVVTSMWRVGARTEELEDLLTSAGVHVSGRVLGATPLLEGRSRGAEITAWLEESPVSVGPFVILDDRGDMDGYRPQLVKTDPQYGLIPSQSDEVVSRLVGYCEFLA